MKKLIKKITVAVMAVIMMVLMLPVNEVKAEDTYTVYVDAPDSWGTPYIWAWSESGGGDLFRSWPGALMNEGSDGYYTYTLTTKYLCMTINNGGDTKTGDIKVNGDDVEIIIADDGSYEMKYRTDYTTEWENSITVTAVVPDDWKNPYIWAWNGEINVFEKWPGVPMKSGTAGYTMELPDWVTSVIISNGSIQTIDIGVEAGKDVWLTVDSESSIKVAYFGEESETIPPTADNPENATTAAGEDTTSTAGAEETTPSGGGDKDDKPNNNMLYIIITVAVFVVIILVVTFTGNGKKKKHSHYAYEEKVAKDIKIDEKDIDVDVDVDVDDIDV